MVSRRYTISVCSFQTVEPLLPLLKLVDTSSVLLKGVSWLYARLHFAILGQFTCWNALITRMMSTFSVNRQSWIQDLRNFNFSQKEADIGHQWVISQKKRIYTFLFPIILAIYYSLGSWQCQLSPELLYEPHGCPEMYMEKREGNIKEKYRPNRATHTFWMNYSRKEQKHGKQEQLRLAKDENLGSQTMKVILWLLW